MAAGFRSEVYYCLQLTLKCIKKARWIGEWIDGKIWDKANIAQ